MATLFDDDEPALRKVTRGQLVEAYAAELEAHPPIPSCAGDTARARSSRKRFAERDVARCYAAAARLGCTISLVPTTAKSGNLSNQRGGDA